MVISLRVFPFLVIYEILFHNFIYSKFFSTNEIKRSVSKFLTCVSVTVTTERKMIRQRSIATLSSSSHSTATFRIHQVKLKVCALRTTTARQRCADTTNVHQSASSAFHNPMAAVVVPLLHGAIVSTKPSLRSSSSLSSSSFFSSGVVTRKRRLCKVGVRAEAVVFHDLDADDFRHPLDKQVY